MLAQGRGWTAGDFRGRPGTAGDGMSDVSRYENDSFAGV